MPINNCLITLAKGGNRKLHCFDNLSNKAVTTCIAFKKQAINLAKRRYEVDEKVDIRVSQLISYTKPIGKIDSCV